MTRIQEANKQIINNISQCSRKDLSERSRKIAEDALATMRALFNKNKKVRRYAKRDI